MFIEVAMMMVVLEGFSIVWYLEKLTKELKRFNDFIEKIPKDEDGCLFFSINTSPEVYTRNTRRGNM